jgi:hypothetical protein
MDKTANLICFLNDVRTEIDINIGTNIIVSNEETYES